MSAPTTGYGVEVEVKPEVSGGPQAPPEAPGTQPSPARFAAVSRVLRGAGSAALVAALSTFLWQHWQEGSDLVRAGTLLAHTGALALAGLFCGLRARDGKAARTFLGLAGASLPIVASVAGGLVYSQLALDAPRNVAAYATWVAPTAAAALIAGLVSVAASLPVAVLAMGVFARRCLTPLAALAVAGNAALLLPIRDADVVAVLAAALLSAFAWIEWRWLQRETSLATFEGLVARGLALAPPLFLLGRSVLHYDLSPLYYAVLCTAAALALTGLSWIERLPGDLRATARWFAVLPAAWGSAAFSAALLEVGLVTSLGLPVAAGVFAVQLVAASLLDEGEEWGHSFRRLAAWAFCGISVANLWIEPGVLASLVAGVGCLAVLAWGTLRSQRNLQALGGAGAVAAVAVHVQHAIELYAWSRWGSLALLGAAVILAASWIEHSGPRALRRFERWAGGSPLD